MQRTGTRVNVIGPTLTCGQAHELRLVETLRLGAVHKVHVSGRWGEVGEDGIFRRQRR